MIDRPPSSFESRWLRFDPQRPTRPRLLKRFVIALAVLMLACAGLLLLSR
jgi:hypothetical protein